MIIVFVKFIGNSSPENMHANNLHFVLENNNK